MLHLLMDIATRAGCRDQTGINELLNEIRPGSASIVSRVLESGLVEESRFIEELSARFAIPVWGGSLPQDPTELEHLRSSISADVAMRQELVPVGLELDSATGETALCIATPDPFALDAHSMAVREVNGPIRWRLARRDQIVAGLYHIYGVGGDTLDQLIESRIENGSMLIGDDTMDISESEDEAASVIAFVNELIRRALDQEATDIHLEPMERDLRIRYRIDGKLHDVPTPQNIGALRSSVISRIKIMAGLDIAERRIPQDGRIGLEFQGQKLDVRVATIPAVDGETVSLRLLGQQRFTINKLGLNQDLDAQIRQLLDMPNGIVLVTGPTGSGKSSSLYAFLSEINRPDHRIVTIEDPVENKLPGIVQIAVKSDIGYTFATGLRSILRGDPNVIMVGEMRDTETAETAMRAALTGHLVFSTLHTNDAISGVTRLIDMGIEPFLVSSSVRAFLAQRLVRRLCIHCRRKEPIDAAQVAAMGLTMPPNETLFGYSALG